MANVISVGQPANEAEREAIAYLRVKLPANYTILHNFELKEGGHWFEIDLAIIAPHAVYVVDLKSTSGEIHVEGNKWQPEGRQPFTSPLPKLRQHARVLKSLIIGTPEDAQRRRIYVDAVVLLTSATAHLNDNTGRDKDSVCPLQGCESFFRDVARLPAQFQPSTNTAPHEAAIRKAIQGKGRPRNAVPIYGNWECDERLGGNENFTEYRAHNLFAGSGAGHVWLRAYKADPYLPADERTAQAKRISNAFRALNTLPSHPSIPAVRDFFAMEGDELFILVTQDVPGSALRLHLKKPSLALTLEQKLRVVRDLLSGLAHIHSNGVIHRAICPSTVVLGSDAQTRLVDFDFARTSGERSFTVGREAVEAIEQRYLAPEVYADPSNSSPASDVYSAGLVIYELFTGEPAFKDLSEAIEQSAVFVQKPSHHGVKVLPGFDEWLQGLCGFETQKRPAAIDALRQFEALLTPTPQTNPDSSAEKTPIDYTRLPAGFILRGKYSVERSLGKPGGFGVVYKVIDTLGDIARVMKIYTALNVDDRMRQEYQTLLRIPPHPNVVRVIDGAYLDGGGPPYLVFEYVEGADLRELIEKRGLSPNDIAQLGLQVTQGLAHLHRNSAFHLDIKPANLLWTQQGVKIIDFNVAVLAGLPFDSYGGTKKYLPPDFDLGDEQTDATRIDRDLFALGITLYEAITGNYPWTNSTVPIPGQSPRDPRELAGCDDLSQKLVEVILKAVAPRRADRFPSADAFLHAWQAIKEFRQPRVSISTTSTTLRFGDVPFGGSSRPNTNSFVTYLLTLFSQSQRSNAGTRGLDTQAEQIYVETALDQELAPAVLAGKFQLVIISGNAGDGKTAFLQTIENNARKRGEAVAPLPSGNGCTFKHSGRRFISNYDGSQDEGEKVNESVLLEFFGPFEGVSNAAWPDHETRLVAINEGRLIDFLETNAKRFPRLRELVQNGLKTSEVSEGVVVINLNLRSVVAQTPGTGASILQRLIRRLTNSKFWAACENCDLRDKCYAYHNARTFQDTVGGPQVADRLTTLYTLTHLRGKLHITLRDLRSALAFMLVGTRDCDQIHSLYESGDRAEIARGFYFNSWVGAGRPQEDRLVRLLQGVDVGMVSEPKLDRAFDFRAPDMPTWLMDFEERGKYDREILRRLYLDLPSDPAGPNAERLRRHREYVAMMRRLHFFECRDQSWKSLLPYQSGEKMLALVRGEEDLKATGAHLIRAISRGEGLFDPQRLKGKLALQVRQVDGGTIRSYRVFDCERFTLAVKRPAAVSPYLEGFASSLVLRYEDASGIQAELDVGLDVFEMLERLNQGYRPTVEEIQGYYLSLMVFKNILGSAPYQEVLLTTTGHEFYAIERESSGRLKMYVAEDASEYGTPKEG